MIRRVDIKDLAKHLSSVSKERYAAGVAGVSRAMKQQARRIIREEIQATMPHPPHDRGEYDRSWMVVDIPGGVRVASTSPYASVIDRGRRPGTRPPIGPLIGWVHRHNMVDASKLGAEAQMAKARAQTTLLAMLAVQKMKVRAFAKDRRAAIERSIAFAIAAKIFKKGQPAKGVFARASVRLIELARAAFREGATSEKASA